MLALAPLAAAHVPHDRVVGVAAPAEGPWLLVAAPGRDSLLLRSDDRGRTWAFLGGAPVADTLLGAAVRDDGTIALLGTASVWLTEDAGETWATVPAPGGTMLAGGGELRLAGETGLTEFVQGAWSVQFAESVHAVSPDGTALVDASGEVWVEAGKRWIAYGSPGEVTALAAGDGFVVAGTRSGETFRARAPGQWATCGLRNSGLPEVARLAVSDGVVLLADASGGPWASTDTCDTWTNVSSPLDVLYEDEGGAADAAEGVAALGVTSGTWWMAGWAGFATSPDAGETWTESVTVPSDYTRGLAFSPRFGVDGTVWWGAYGAGVARAREGGWSFDAPNGGLGSPNVQELKARADGEDVDVLAIVAHHLFRSLDGGETWVSLATPFALDDQVFPWEEPDHLWAAGRVGTSYTSASVAETWDGGATWTTFDAFDEALASAEPRGLVHASPDGHPDVACIGSYGATLACTEDDGATWARRFEGEGTMSSPVGWPAGRPTRLVLADGAGVHHSDDGGRAWATDDPLDGDAAGELAVAGDGSLFLTTATGRLLRSEDGGATWADLGVRFGGPAFVLAPRPGFTDHDDLLVGGADGVWHVLDAAGEPSLARWGAWQRVEESGTYFLRCEGCAAPEARDGASLGTVQRLRAGDTLAGWMRGHTVRVLGVEDGRGAASLRVDGAEVAALRAADGVLAEVAGLDDAWHYVEVVGRDGESVLVDALEAESWGSRLDVDTPTEGCGRGCAALLLTPALPLLARRRARSRASPRS